MSSTVPSRERIIVRGIARATRLQERGIAASTHYTRIRVAIFVSAVAVCLFLFQHSWFHTGNTMLALFLVAFFVVTHSHGRLHARLRRIRKWMAIKNSHLARVRLDWASLPPAAIRNPAAHPYAIDLDITGPHSLLHLLDVTVSISGRDRLSTWLLDQHTHVLTQTEWRARQALVKELSRRSLLRDRMRLESALVSETPLHAERIHQLLDRPVPIPHLTTRLYTSIALCVLTLLLSGLTIGLGWPPYGILTFGLYATLYFFTSPSLGSVFNRVQSLHHELQHLGAITSVVETRTMHSSPQLRILMDPLINHPERPSKTLRALASICAGLSIKAHPLIHMLVNAIVPWDLSYAVRLQHICTRIDRVLPLWLDCVGTLDAASSLANFGALNPCYTWPTLDDVSAGCDSPGLTATTLGHPLLSTRQRVCNDVHLRGTGQVFLVTGSNMSGKSTFLRTIGLNICLAQAGAPVCATDFTWTAMRIACCIRVTDSLDEGLSYFYAEVKRLKAILDAVRVRDAAPVLFLIDEIYKGTNNRERLAGSRAYLHALLDGNGLGLLTTHDLELSQLADDHPRLTNVHFQEHIQDGRLSFDYRLRTGPCPTTNALRIMQQEGLPTPDGEE